MSSNTIEGNKAPELATSQKRFKETLLQLLMFIVPLRYKTRLMYDFGSTDSFLTEKTHYMNIGYWKDNPETLDEACEAMAQLLGKEASLGLNDRILDVGFGFADQDLLWAKHYQPQEIVGLNISSSQVSFARERVKQAKLEKTITLQQGSATAIPFSHESFDKVVGLECAFHFITREKFFHEAYRVLKPGGRLALVEPIPQPSRSRVNPFARYLYRTMVPTPKENLYTRDVYAQKLEKAGFKPVRVTSIEEYVHPCFLQYCARKLKDPDFVKRISPQTLKSWSALLNEKSLLRQLVDTSDYVVAIADKPQ